MTLSVLRNERPLPLAGLRATFLEALFIAATVVTPLVAHTFGWPVFHLLPMFWGVMLAGAVFGWNAGLLAGLLAPLLNHLLTGMPAEPMVPLMTVELALYGTVPALLAATILKGNLYIGMALGILLGRGALVVGFLLALGGPQELGTFLSRSVVPGIPVQLLQIFLVPIVGGVIIRAIKREH